MNFIRCNFDGGRLHTVGGSISLPSSVRVPEEKSTLKLGIRPRFVSFAKPGADGALKGRTEMVQEFGNYRIATVRIEEDIVRLKLPPGTEVPADDAWISFPENKICFYANDVLVNSSR
jgi:glycerol transport system ATP-binding protein